MTTSATHSTIFDCTAYGKLGRCCRYSFYTSNSLSAFTCTCAVGFGIWVIAKKRLVSALFEPTLYVSVAFILVVIGTLALCSAISGCYAASRELRFLMYSFSVINFVLFLMLLIGGAMGFVFQVQVSEIITYTKAGSMKPGRWTILKDKALNLQMITALQNFYGEATHSEVTQAWDYIQEQYKCCGVDSTNDANYLIWRTSKWHMDNKDNPKRQVPLSCCTKNLNSYVDQDSCQFLDLQQPNASVLYSSGCYKSFYQDLMSISTVEASLGIAASISLLMPSFFAAFLARLIQK